MIDTEWFERIIVFAISVLLMAIIGVTTVWLFILFGLNLFATVIEVDTATDLQEAVQRAMGGVFVVLLGLELLETVKMYAKHHRIRLEIVVVVGAIAVARHVVQLDFHDVDGAFLGGLGLLIASLVGGFYLLSRIPSTEAGGSD